MNDLKIGIFGQILEGKQKGWYVFIQDDAESSGGYFILFSGSRSMADPRGFDDWVEDCESLQQYFQGEKWKIKWLEDEKKMRGSYANF